MSRKWVVNASPVIALTKIGQLSLLAELCDEMIIPLGVAGEIQVGTEDDPAKNWIKNAGRKWIMDVGSVDPVIASWDLGCGEAEVLSWACKHTGYEANIDDKIARNCLSMNIRVRGTIGIILLAKRIGKIDRVVLLLEELIRCGFRIHPRLFDEARRIGQ